MCAAAPAGPLSCDHCGGTSEDTGGGKRGGGHLSMMYLRSWGFGISGLQIANLLFRVRAWGLRFLALYTEGFQK